MRDVERLREKHEISLDDRQIAALAFCAMVLLAGVFALGIMLGRHSAPPAPMQADLGAMDAAAKQRPPPPPAKVAAAPVPMADPPADDEPAEQGKPPESIPPQAAPAQARAAMVVPPPPRPVQVASAAPIELTPPPKDTGAFTVQVGATQDKAEARKLQQRVLGAGLKPYVMQADLGAKGTWYRVRVGAFPDKDAANSFRKDVERELRVAAVVMPAR